MFYLNETQETIIELLAKYKYLTSSQFVEMGVYKRRAYLTRSLKPLLDMKKPLIKKFDFNPINGKIESFYYLTKYGKQFLIDELGYLYTQIKIHKGLSPIKLKDYYHRRFSIDFHINLNLWLSSNKGNIAFLDYYFDKSGNNRSTDQSQYVTALNRIQIDKNNSFIPDINTMFSVNEKKYLYLFEQHDGKDTKRLFEQLQPHIIAISKNSVQKKYKLKSSHRVVVVCEFENVKNSILQRLQKVNGIEHYNNFFIFKTNEELKEDFFNNWTLINGKSTTFIPINTH